jgi:uptake hydrogenase large subunit
LQDIFSDKETVFEGPNNSSKTTARAMMNVNTANLPHQCRDPLFGDIMKKWGPGVFVRCLARMHEATRLYTLLNKWLSEINLDEEFT